MRPSGATFDPAYGVRPDAIVESDQSLDTCIFPDSANLLFGKFCAAAALTAIACPMLYSIRLISGRSVPSQISHEIVLWVSITMAAFMFFWWWANKSKEDKAMNFHHFAFVTIPKKNIQTAIFWIWCWLFNPRSFYRSNAAMVGNIVQPLKAKNRFPVFHFVPQKYSPDEIVPDWSME